jgi:hypothetical protein
MPFEEECVIRLPNREWAAVGAAELEALGYRAWVADEPGPDGRWPVVVRGTPDQIAALRGELPQASEVPPPAEPAGEASPRDPEPRLLCPAFDWQTFVNDAASGIGR